MDVQWTFSDSTLQFSRHPHGRSADPVIEFAVQVEYRKDGTQTRRRKGGKQSPRIPSRVGPLPVATPVLRIQPHDKAVRQVGRVHRRQGVPEKSSPTRVPRLREAMGQLPSSKSQGRIREEFMAYLAGKSRREEGPV